jgi:hypothetical protein
VNTPIRKTRACAIDALDEDLKAAIRAHGLKFGVEDIESEVLMCCETITIRQKKGFLGGIKTTLSAAYVTPKWLVWADSTGGNDVVVGMMQLDQIDMSEYRSTTRYRISPDQGLNITGRFPDKNRTGITFIALEAKADGQKFRRVLDEALRKIVE